MVLTLIQDMVTSIVRSVLTESVSGVTPDATREAILDDVSLMDACGVDISDISSRIPPFVSALGRAQLNNYLAENKLTATSLALVWLKEDRPDLYTTIMKSENPSGIKWFDRQVNAILDSVL